MLASLMSVIFAEAGAFKHLQQSSGFCNANVKPSSEEEDFRYGPR